MSRVSWLVLVVLLLTEQALWPCTVESIGTVAEATAAADAVFVGRVISMTDQLEGSPDEANYVRRVVLNVRDVWKGPHRAHLVVWTMPGEGVCGVPFVKGELFVVFAGKANGTYATSISWPSARLRGSQQPPSELGRPKWHNAKWPKA